MATRYAAHNHSRSDICVLCITVPAVTDVCAPQLLHCHTRRAWCIAPTSPPPHRRQRNPSGQRQANRYSRHASSEAKRSWNSMIVRGNPGLGIPVKLRPTASGRRLLERDRLASTRGHRLLQSLLRSSVGAAGSQTAASPHEAGVSSRLLLSTKSNDVVGGSHVIATVALRSRGSLWPDASVWARPSEDSQVMGAITPSRPNLVAGVGRHHQQPLLGAHRLPHRGSGIQFSDNLSPRRSPARKANR